MIEYLGQLVEQKKYREAVDLAERLIGQVEDPHDLVRIHAARVVSLCMLGQESAALASGDFAMPLAKELGDWDSYGTLALYVGVAYSHLGQLAEAVVRMYEYLAELHQYHKAAAFEYSAWYNLGIMEFNLGKPDKATLALANALKAAVRHGEDYAHGVRHSLVDAYLRMGSYEPISRLLAQCARYLRHNPDMTMHKMSWAYHVQLRCEYALATGRVDRARAIASRALSHVVGEPQYEFLFHVVLAKAAHRCGNGEQALGHALAARTCAVTSRRSDWETEANDLMLELTQRFPGALESVDRYFTSGW